MASTAFRSWIFAVSTAGLTSCAWPSPEGSWVPPVDEAADAGPSVDEEAPACAPVGGIGYARPKPNVMFLVDRSGSMAEPGACADAPCGSKWQQLLALSGYLREVKSLARLGVSFFPAVGQDGCAVSASPMVPLSEAPDVDQRILEAVGSVAPGGRTPIPQALDAMAEYGGLASAERDNIIVLLTDGQPTCTCDGDVTCEQPEALAAVERLLALPVPIKLDVIGFGSSASSASNTLSAMAVAAGTARDGVPRYYQADTVETLIQSLYEISAGLAPCRFNLDEWPAAEELVVHLDDGEVPACNSDPCLSGYTYDASQGVVELEGVTCEAIRDGACHSVWFETSTSP